MKDMQGPNNDYVTLAQAAHLIPSQPSPSTLWRWCRRGIRAADGTRDYLQHVRYGRRVFTCAAWLNDFAQSVAQRDVSFFEDRREAPAPRSLPRDRKPEERVDAATAAAERMKQRRGNQNYPASKRAQRE